MGQVTGIVKIYVNGTLQRSKEGAKLVFGGKERTPQVGHSVYGFSEKVVASQLEYTLAHLSDDDLIALNDTTEAEVKFETDTGISFLVTNAFTSKPIELTSGEGEVSVEMMGDPAEQE